MNFDIPSSQLNFFIIYLCRNVQRQNFDKNHPVGEIPRGGAMLSANRLHCEGKVDFFFFQAVPIGQCRAAGVRADAGHLIVHAQMHLAVLHQFVGMLCPEQGIGAVLGHIALKAVVRCEFQLTNAKAFHTIVVAVLLGSYIGHIFLTGGAFVHSHRRPVVHIPIAFNRSVTVVGKGIGLRRKRPFKAQSGQPDGIFADIASQGQINLTVCVDGNGHRVLHKGHTGHTRQSAFHQDDAILEGADVNLIEGNIQVFRFPFVVVHPRLFHMAVIVRGRAESGDFGFLRQLFFATDDDAGKVTKMLGEGIGEAFAGSINIMVILTQRSLACLFFGTKDWG